MAYPLTTVPIKPEPMGQEIRLPPVIRTSPVDGGYSAFRSLLPSLSTRPIVGPPPLVCARVPQAPVVQPKEESPMQPMMDNPVEDEEMDGDGYNIEGDDFVVNECEDQVLVEDYMSSEDESTRREDEETSECLLVSEESDDSSSPFTVASRPVNDYQDSVRGTSPPPLTREGLFAMRAANISQQARNTAHASAQRVGTMAELMPDECEVFVNTLQSEPATNVSRSKWPVSDVMVINVDSTKFRSLRRLKSLLGTSIGCDQMRLLELLTHTCYKAGGQDTSKDKANTDKGPRRSRSRPGEGRSTDPPPSNGVTGQARTELNMITSILGAGVIRGGSANAAGRTGEAMDIDSNCPPGTFLHSFPNDVEGEGDIEAWIPCTSQFMEGVRSSEEDAHLVTIRFWLIIHDPKFDVTGELETMLKRHDKERAKSAENRTQPTMAARFDSPINWKIYRSITSASEYGRLLDRHFGSPMSLHTQVSIRSLPPTMTFGATDDTALATGLSGFAVNDMCPRQKTLDTYLCIDQETGKITLREPLLRQDLRLGIKELTRSELIPEHFCELRLPNQVVEVDPVTGLIVTPEDMEVEVDERLEHVRSLLDTLASDDARENLQEKLKETRQGMIDRATASESMWSGLDPVTGDRVAWDADEIAEIETSNKALSHKDKNHKKRISLRAQYMTQDPDKYIEEMKAFQENAANRLIADLTNFREEKDAWYEAIVKILAFGESLPPREFWPAFAVTCDNIGIFGNAMIQEYTKFIHAFRIQPGWKPRDLQKYMTINLNVLEYEFSLHLHALLSGAAMTGKSFLLQKLIEMRVAGTIEKITMLTEKSLTSDPRAFNYKTVVMEEAESWCLGMGPDGKPTKMQSSILKDILSSCTANSLRCNWNEGEVSRSATFCVMMTNFIFASNWGYPPKSSPLVSRLLVEDVADNDGKSIAVSKVAFSLVGQQVDSLNERLCKDKKVEQYLHLIVELFILAEVLDPKVNLDIPMYLMEDAFNHLKDHHDVPMPSMRFREQLLKTCRVLTIQNAIRGAYFTEKAQLKHQYVLSDEKDAAGNLTGLKSMDTTRDGKPRKKRFDMKTIVADVGPRLWCTEDTFAYAMTMLEGHIVPKLEADVLGALSQLVRTSNKDYRRIKGRMVDPTRYRFDPQGLRHGVTSGGADDQEFGGAPADTSSAMDTELDGAAPAAPAPADSTEPLYERSRYSPYRSEKVYAQILDPDYYMIEFDSREAFYREVAAHCEKGLCETSVQTIINELKERMIKVDRRPNKLQFEATNESTGEVSLIVMVDEISKKMVEEQTSKQKKIPYLRISKSRRGIGLSVCIAQALVETPNPQPNTVLGMLREDGTLGSSQGASQKRFKFHGNAMKEALKHTLCYHTTRPRDIVLSKSHRVGPDQVYHELLDTLRVEPVARVLYKEQCLVEGHLGPLLIYYSDEQRGEDTHQYRGTTYDNIIVRDNLETEIAKKHAKWIGVKYDPSVLPMIEDEEIRRVRFANPELFPNITINYPTDARFLIDTQGAQNVYVKKRIDEANTVEKINALFEEDFTKARLLENYYEPKLSNDEASASFEEKAMDAVLSEPIETTNPDEKERIMYERFCAAMGQLGCDGTAYPRYEDAVEEEDSHTRRDENYGEENRHEPAVRLDPETAEAEGDRIERDLSTNPLVNRVDRLHLQEHQNNQELRELAEQREERAFEESIISANKVNVSKTPLDTDLDDSYDPGNRGKKRCRNYNSRTASLTTTAKFMALAKEKKVYLQYSQRHTSASRPPPGHADDSEPDEAEKRRRKKGKGKADTEEHVHSAIVASRVMLGDESRDSFVQ